MARGNVGSKELCLRIFDYDAETGAIFWRHRDDVPNWWNTRYAGREAFTSLDTDGYKSGTINGKPVRAQYVVWAMHYGTDFPEIIDHINRNRSDNRIENLRSANAAENARNRSSSMSKSRCVGVYETKEGRWRARSRRGQVMNELGTYEKKEDAIDAYFRFVGNRIK